MGIVVFDVLARLHIESESGQSLKCKSSLLPGKLPVSKKYWWLLIRREQGFLLRFGRGFFFNLIQLINVYVGTINCCWFLVLFFVFGLVWLGTGVVCVLHWDMLSFLLVCCRLPV